MLSVVLRKLTSIMWRALSLRGAPALQMERKAFFPLSRRCLAAPSLHAMSTGKHLPEMEVSPAPAGMGSVLLIESGVCTDQHGQDVTKACIRACKDAISFNSVPNLMQLCGGRDNIKLRIQLAVPFETKGGATPAPPPLDLDAVRDIFPCELPSHNDSRSSADSPLCSAPCRWNGSSH